jgi:hypothetical protein
LRVSPCKKLAAAAICLLKIICEFPELKVGMSKILAFLGIFRLRCHFGSDLADFFPLYFIEKMEFVMRHDKLTIFYFKC